MPLASSLRSASRKRPLSPPAPPAVNDDDHERPTHAHARIGCAKGWCRFVKPILDGSQLCFPKDFPKTVFPAPELAAPPTNIDYIHCGKCPKLWNCLELFPDEQGELESNVSWGYAPGIFRSRVCYFYRQNGNALKGYIDSEQEDKLFRTIQADSGGLIYLEPIRRQQEKAKRE